MQKQNPFFSLGLKKIVPLTFLYPQCQCGTHASIVPWCVSSFVPCCMCDEMNYVDTISINRPLTLTSSRFCQGVHTGRPSLQLAHDPHSLGFMIHRLTTIWSQHANAQPQPQLLFYFIFIWFWGGIFHHRNVGDVVGTRFLSTLVNIILKSFLCWY